MLEITLVTNYMRVMTVDRQCARGTKRDFYSENQSLLIIVIAKGKYD